MQMKKNIKYKLIITVIMILTQAILCQINISEATEKATNTSLQEGTYIIRSALNTKYVLDVAAASKSNGANIQLFQYDNVNQQKFKVKPLGNGYYSITALHSGKSLDVAGRRKQSWNEYLAI